jgi:hypothetical protein
VVVLLPSGLDPVVERLDGLWERRSEAAPHAVVVEELVQVVVGWLRRPESNEPAGQERRMRLHRRRIDAEEEGDGRRSRRELSPDRSHW